MTKKKFWLAFAGVIAIVALAQLACNIPYMVQGGGTITSANGTGKAQISLHGGCDYDTNEVSGLLVYNDGPVGVGFRADIDFDAEPTCEYPEPEEWLATGPYTPIGGGDSGTFYLGLFAPSDPNYPDDERCASCESCWRLWLEDGVFSGYENWACDLEHGKITIWEEPNQP
jgi:hypothetical protein